MNLALLILLRRPRPPHPPYNAFYVVLGGGGFLVARGTGRLHFPGFLTWTWPPPLLTPTPLYFQYPIIIPKSV